MTLPRVDAYLEPTWDWLARANHPAANLLLRRHDHDVPWSAGSETDRRALLGDPAVVAALEKQGPDGSWGVMGPSEDRIMPTLWVVKTLVDAGLDADTTEVDKALTFLGRVARAKRWVFSTTADDRGVLACYVGLAARLYGDAGRPDLAKPQIEWLTQFQQVSVAGEARRETADWGNELETRYGGCFAATSCLVGVVRAAEAWREAEGDEASEAFDVAKGALLERGLAYTRDGAQLLPLKSQTSDDSSWVRPAFPSDWRIDLVDIVHAFGGRVDPLDMRPRKAVALLMAARHPDGSWARGWHVTSAFLRGFGAAPRGEGNPIATARTAVALARWLA